VGERKKGQIRTHHERCGHPKDPVTDRGDDHCARESPLLFASTASAILDSDLDHGVQLTAVVLSSFRLRRGAITTLQEAQTITFSRHAKAEKGNLVISQGEKPRKSQQSMPPLSRMDPTWVANRRAVAV
jgi:hypothetical protein